MTQAVIAVTSPCGGVGKTSIANGLMACFAEAGLNVQGIDLCGQNALQLVANEAHRDVNGWARASLAGLGWQHANVRLQTNWHLLPHGFLNNADSEEMTHWMLNSGDWLKSGSASLNLKPDTVLVLDSPAGRNNASLQAMAMADLVITVVKPDAMSYAAFPYAAAALQECRPPNSTSSGLAHWVVVNQRNAHSALARDIEEGFRDQLPDGTVFAIQQDSAVAEAVSHSTHLLAHDRHSKAAHDTMALAQMIASRF